MIFNESNYLTFPFKVGMMIRYKLNNTIGTVVGFYSFTRWRIIVKFEDLPGEGAYSQEELEIIK